MERVYFVVYGFEYCCLGPLELFKGLGPLELFKVKYTVVWDHLFKVNCLLSLCVFGKAFGRQSSHAFLYAIGHLIKMGKNLFCSRYGYL